jgi:ADP-heptose:LPS heptosyltransferase
LISGMGSIRETILTLPVAVALRERFPDAHLVWAVEKRAAAVVAKHPALNQTIELERGWFVTPTLVSQARHELRSHRFDISIDCGGVAKTALAGWLSGASQRIGFCGRHGRGLSRRLNNTVVQPVFTHLTDRNLELLVPLEIHSPKIRWDFPITEAARNWAARWRRTIPNGRLAIMHPGAGWESKRWEPDRYATVARHLAERYGYRTVVAWGKETERQLAQTIVADSRTAATLAPDTDLQHLAALLERADLFLGSDSAPLHLAAAMGTSSIGLFGATQPEAYRPYGQIAIAAAIEQGNRRRRSRATNAAMRRIEASRVCQVIDEIEGKRQHVKAA